MKNFLHTIACALVACTALVAFAACSDDDEGGNGTGTGEVTGTLTAETSDLEFTSGTYSKVLKVATEGTVGALKWKVAYKGGATGWITPQAVDGGVLVTVEKNTGDARTADVVLGAEGAEPVTVAVSQKAVFVSDIIGRYKPRITENSTPEMQYGDFFLTPVYEGEEPTVDLSFILGDYGKAYPMPAVCMIAQQLIQGLYAGGLDYFEFKEDGRIGAGYCELLDFTNMQFGPVTDFPNPETLEVLPIDAITYFTRDGKVYFAIDKGYLTAVGQQATGMYLPEIIDEMLKQYPGLGIESTDEYYAIPLKYELAEGVLTLKVDREMMLPYAPLIESLIEMFVPEGEIEVTIDPSDPQPMHVPAQKLLLSLVDGLIVKSQSLEIGVVLTR